MIINNIPNKGSKASSYEALTEKPKLNNVEIEGDKVASDYHLTYMRDFQDNTPYQGKEQMGDYLQSYAGQEVLPGYRDKVVIPDIYSTGVKTKNSKNEPITFIDITTVTPTIFLKKEVYKIGEVKGEGTPFIFLKYGDAKLQLNGLVSESTVGEEILIENYDFSKVKIECIWEERYAHRIKLVYKNCIFGRYKGFFAGKKNLVDTYFENCDFEGAIDGSHMIFNKCKFHADTCDAMNFDRDVDVNNSLVYDLQRKAIAGEIHIDGVQIYGHKDSFCENIHFKNTRFSIPSFYFGPENNTYVNGAIMLQLEYCNGRNFSFEDIVADYGGKWHPFFSTSKNGMVSTDILFKNTLASDYYGEGADGAIRFNAELNKPQLVELNTMHELYIGSVWKEGKKVYLSCTNTSVKKAIRTLTVLTNEGEETFEIQKCPSLEELEAGGKYAHYRYKDMPYDIKIELKIPADRCQYLICYDGDKQIRFVNFTDKNVYIPVKKNLPYDILGNKPAVNGCTLEGALKGCQILNDDAGRIVSEMNYDLSTIPDKTNTGLSDEAACINSVAVDTAIPEYDNLYFTTNETGKKIYLDFNWNSKNRYLVGGAVIQDVDFKKNYPEGFEFQHLEWHQGRDYKDYVLIFRNCNFGNIDFIEGREVARSLIIGFENCRFERINNVPGKYSHCLVTHFNNTPIVASSYSYFSECYITNANYSDTSVASNINGVLISGKQQVTFEKCRFEIPNVGGPGKIQIDSIFNIKENAYNDVRKILIKDCFLNGGVNYLDCASSSGKEITILNNFYGDNYNEGYYSSKEEKLSAQKILPNISKEVSKQNKTFLKLYISSIFKDESGKLHFYVTNDSREARRLTVYTNNGATDFVIPGQELMSSTLSTEAIDSERVLEQSNINYAIFYDEGSQIRFVNYSNDYIEQPLNTERSFVEINNEASQTYNLLPGLFTVFTVPTTQLQVAMDNIPVNKNKPTVFEFTSGAGATTVSIPQDFKWNGGSAPKFEPNTIYQIKLFGSLAYIIGFAAK